MVVVHFTSAAADPLTDYGATGARRNRARRQPGPVRMDTAGALGRLSDCVSRSVKNTPEVFPAASRDASSAGCEAQSGRVLTLSGSAASLLPLCIVLVTVQSPLRISPRDCWYRFPIRSRLAYRRANEPVGFARRVDESASKTT